LKHILTHIKQAAHETAQIIEGEIRQSALEHGWDKDVVANTHVRYHNNSFNVYVHDEHVGNFLTHEFGNETTRPTAVVRKYNNSSKGAAAFMQSLSKKMGGSK
jgi:capsule polysaccharide modification protein KpsS